MKGRVGRKKKRIDGERNKNRDEKETIEKNKKKKKKKSKKEKKNNKEKEAFRREMESCEGITERNDREE